MHFYSIQKSCYPRSVNSGTKVWRQDNQYNSIQHNDTLHYSKKRDTKYTVSFLYAEYHADYCAFTVALSVVMLNVVLLSVMAPKDPVKYLTGADMDIFKVSTFHVEVFII
jgi:hypothetical protein